MKISKKVLSKIAVILGLSFTASLCPETAQAQFIQRSFFNPSFEQNLTPSTTKPSSPGATTIPISTRTNCYVQVDQTSVLGWLTTHTSINGTGNCPSFVSPGSANLIELWTRNFSSDSGGGVIPPDGNVFAELNAEQNSQLFQNLCLFNNETIQFSVNHRGRTSPTVADVASFVINSQRAVQFATSNNATANSTTTPFAPTNATNIVTNATAVVGASAPGWVRHSGSLRYTGTSGNVPVGFAAISTASVPVNLTTGNFIDNAQFAGLPIIEFSASSGGAAEAESSPTSNPPKIRVVGVVPTGGIVVPISIGTGSTAVLGTDFNTPNGTTNFTMTIPAGNYNGSNATSTFFIPFTIIQDGTTEGNETIIFQIGSSPGVYFVSSTTACGTSPIQNATYTVFDDEFLSGNVFNDINNSANGTFTNIQTGAEVGTNVGGLLNAILVSSTGNVLATTPVNANGTYIFNDVPFNQSNVTIRLSASAGTLGNAAPAAALPTGWVATSPLVTAPFSTGTSITNKDFGINQPIVFGYKSVNLTADPDNSGVVSTGDTLTWRITYANTGAVDIPDFQIIDRFTDIFDGDLSLATPITVTVSGTQITVPTLNASYTGNGDNNLFSAVVDLKAGGTITIEVKTVVGASATLNQVLFNQATARGTNLPVAGVQTDNIDKDTTGLPIPAPNATGNILQTQRTPEIDPTTVTIGQSSTTPIFKLLLVKRITAVNDLAIATFEDDLTSPQAADDSNLNWPDSDISPSINSYLRGAINLTNIKPSDRLEYTIYFLVAGNRAITNVTLCDLIPANTTFVNGAYDVAGGGSNLGIAFANNASSLPTVPTNYFTSIFDGDRGQFYPADSLPPTACKKPNPASPNNPATNLSLTTTDNANGLVVVNVVSSSPTLTTLPHATTSGFPTNSYGFVRFQVQVK
jgi:uncharacterized repeat protein (TIGR01451 family)